MLKINIKDFNFSRFLEDLKESDLQRNIMQGGYILDLKVNYEMLECDRSDCLFHNTLKSYNNALYKLIMGFGDEYINTGLGTGVSRLVRISKVGNNLIFEFKPYGTNKRWGVYQTNFVQALEEFTKAVREYRSICERVIKVVTPDNVEESLRLLLKEVSWVYEPWFPLAQAWTDYKKQHNITDEDVKKAITEEEEKEKKMKKTWWQVWK